jgi:hypothetical protein
MVCGIRGSRSVPMSTALQRGQRRAECADAEEHEHHGPDTARGRNRCGENRCHGRLHRFVPAPSVITGQAAFSSSRARSQSARSVRSVRQRARNSLIAEELPHVLARQAECLCPLNEPNMPQHRHPRTDEVHLWSVGHAGAHRVARNSAACHQSRPP